MATATAAKKFPWWLSPMSVVVVLGGFGIYATWAVFVGRDYEFGSYLSPFYSPLLIFPWWKFSPGILMMWIPLGFRLTCYYYRKAYYRSFFWDPPACAKPEPRGERYSGETKFPFILQNLHRYFFYGSSIVWFFLLVDTINAFNFGGQFGIGFGSLLFAANVLLLGFYTFSCHSLRHIIGGNLDCFSCSLVTRTQHKAWEKVSMMNKNHMLWAWMSLFSVALSDLYVRLLAMGVIQDLRFF